MPYEQGASLDMKDNMNGYYKTSQDYADALINEDATNGAMVYSTMTGGGFNSRNYYGFNKGGRSAIKERIAYAKGPCRLLTPDGMYDEDVDSMIDKFVSQKEYLVTAHFNLQDVDAEFEEELREWGKETLNILLAAKEMREKGMSKAESDNFVNTNIPRRELRLSFLNKSGKRVNFLLKSCEVERKIAKNRYLLYVNKMEILK
jgi:hypothetical protein